MKRRRLLGMGALVLGQGIEERGEPGGRGVRRRKPVTGDAAVLPGADRGLERRGTAVVPQGGPARGRQHHEHDGQSEQCAPDVQLRGGVEGSHWEDTLGEREGLALTK